jgi:hypothetical protein
VETVVKSFGRKRDDWTHPCVPPPFLSQELIKTLETMYDRTSTSRARNAVHRSKAIPDESNRFTAGNSDGTAAVAAASTIGQGFDSSFGDGEEESSGAEFEDDYEASNGEEGSASYTNNQEEEGSASYTNNQEEEGSASYTDNQEEEGSASYSDNQEEEGSASYTDNQEEEGSASYTDEQGDYGDDYGDDDRDSREDSQQSEGFFGDGGDDGFDASFGGENFN